MTRSDLTDFEQLKLSDCEVRKTNRELGTGAYGKVFEVEMGGTLFAAKEMHVILRSQESERNFRRECLECSRVWHPNVVQFIGLHYDRLNSNSAERLPWLIMELMETSLCKLIDKYANNSKDIPMHFKLSILLDTCKGLQFLHSKNIIHRDLSSNNILLTKHCVAKIADLGVAKVVNEDTQNFTTAPGTPAFSPPEARVAKPTYGSPYDVFSLGCVCIHLVSMQFPKPTEEMEMDETGKLKRVDLTEYERRIEYLTNFADKPDLQLIVERCLKDDPIERPVAADVIEDLKNVSYDHQPHENDGIIDLYDSMIDYKVQLEEKEKVIEEKDLLLAVAESEKDFVSQQLKHQKAPMGKDVVKEDLQQEVTVDMHAYGHKHLPKWCNHKKN